MRRCCVGLVFVLLVSACESGESALGEVDDRPPPFRDHGFSVLWSTDDPDPPTDQRFADDILEYRLPILLIPSSPPGGEVGKVSLNVHNVGFDRFVLVSASSAETSSWLRVTSSNQLDAVDCGAAGSPVTIRGVSGCFGVEEPGRLILSWEEEWVYEARWTQDPGAPPDQHLEFFRDWLNNWTAHRP